jgi:hypothetical protein
MAIKDSLWGFTFLEIPAKELLGIDYMLMNLKLSMYGKLTGFWAEMLM